jgi:hypothetical protein
MKFSVMRGLVGVLLLGAFEDIQGTVHSHLHQDEQPENPLMKVRRQDRLTGNQQDFALTDFVF